MESTVQEGPTGAENIRWNLGDLYTGLDDPAIEEDIQQTSARADAFAEAYHGKVTALNDEELYEAIVEFEQLVESATKVGSFANLLWSTDTRNAQYGALVQRTQEWAAQLQQKLVFFELEWTNAPDEFVQKMLQSPTLQHFEHWLETTRRYQPHRLSEPEEKILAEKAVTGQNAWTRFFSEFMGNMRFPFEGEELTQEGILSKLYEGDRNIRQRAAAAFTGQLQENLPVLTYIFNTLAVEKASNDRLRQYPTWISSRNLDNEVSDEVVNALIEAVTSRYDIVSRYYTIKRDLLEVDELFDYDRYAPLPAADSFYPWDKAKNMVLNAYHKFHPTVGETVELFFDNAWIDAPPAHGKRSGAFCAYTNTSNHPYVLVNYTAKARDVMTLAHELGHGLHGYLAREQGQLQADTPLTTAEMASTFGEMLVFSDFMASEDDPKVRLAMLANKIEDTFATVFRQISMNRFEEGMHLARRSEGELPSDRFSEIWMESQRTMFGDSVTMTDNYAIWWSYIPHFLHVPGYVYAYSFGELLVLALFARYRQEGDAFAPRYLDVLRAGGSDWPENTLAPMGVDLTDPHFWQEGLGEIEAMIVQLEALMDETGG